jgi:hypothetical protein
MTPLANLRTIVDDVFLIHGVQGFAVSLKNHPEAFLKIYDDVEMVMKGENGVRLIITSGTTP